MLQEGELYEDSGEHPQMQRSLHNISEGGDRKKQSPKSIQFNNDSEGKYDEQSANDQPENEDFTEAAETKDDKQTDSNIGNSDEDSF